MMNHFNRMAVISAASILTDSKLHSATNRLLLEYELQERIGGSNLQDKANNLAAFALSEPNYVVTTLRGDIGLQEAIIHEAINVAPKHREGEQWQKLISGLLRDGFTLKKIEENVGEDWSPRTVTTYELQKLYPEDIPKLDFPETESEVIGLLEEFGFALPKEHLKNAISQHSLGNWSEANGEIRKVFEGLLNQISDNLFPSQDQQGKDSKAKRLLLLDCDPPFLLADMNELRADNKHTYIQGLMNRLHPAGGHEGLSDDEDSTFRLHVVIITIRLLLKRYKKRIMGAD